MTCLTVHHGFGVPSTGVFLRRRSTIIRKNNTLRHVRPVRLTPGMS